MLPSAYPAAVTTGPTTIAAARGPAVPPADPVGEVAGGLEGLSPDRHAGPERVANRSDAVGQTDPAAPHTPVELGRDPPGSTAGPEGRDRTAGPGDQLVAEP